MRRTKHRRRFHTDRVIANRQARHLREDYYFRYWRGKGEALWTLEDGRLKHTDAYHDCGVPRCGCCHWSKFNEPRRTREKRAWRREWGLL